jgi:uncharacterized phage protein (TIGR01671 family)
MNNLKLRIFIPGHGMKYSNLHDRNWYDHPEKCIGMRLKHQRDHVFPLMIFSGWLDKFGNKIYEGDILKSSNDGKNGFDEWDAEIATVIFNINDGIQIKPIDDDILWDFDNPDSMYSLMFCEIIGNIHENPDLLEKK